MISGTGEILSFLDISIAIGATIRSVDTFSRKALINPVKAARKITAHFTLEARRIIWSLKKSGTLESIKSETTPAVPTNIKMTFQSILQKAAGKDRELNGNITKAPARATKHLLFGSAIIST